MIYTSGTTGLPKAASISHRRILNWGGWFAGLTDANPDDRLYNCLLVYHGAGLDSTETFRQKKQLLMREGFDPSVVGEPLCFRDPKYGEYRALDAAVFAEIAGGTVRF